MFYIYAIRQKSSGKTYIGSTEDLKRRLVCHKGWLRQDRHYNQPLQDAWNEAGSDDFEFVELETGTDPDLKLEREQWWMDQQSDLFNISKKANNSSAEKVPFKPEIISAEKVDGSMLTAKELAAKFNVKKRVALGWLQRGVFPNASKITDGFGVEHWQVPETDLAGFEPQRRSGKPYSETASKSSILRRGKRSKKNG